MYRLSITFFIFAVKMHTNVMVSCFYQLMNEASEANKY